MGSSSSRPTTPPPDHGSIRSSIAKKKHIKENTISPFVRSISCGASSLWRTNSFTQESRTKGGDGQVISSKCEERPRLPGQLRNIGEKSVEKNSFDHSRFAETGVGDSGASSIGTDSSSICTRVPFLHQRSSSRHLQQRGSQEYATLISQRHFAADGQSSSSGLSDFSVEHCPREGIERNTFSSMGSSLRVEGISRDVLEVENQSNDEDSEGSYRPPQIGAGDALSVIDSSQNTALGHSLDDVGTLHVEALGLVAQTLDESSNVLRGEASGREARRNSRRRLWDALTRATTRRRRFSPSTLLANQDMDGLSRVNYDWSLFDWRSNEQGPLADQSDSVVRRPQMDQRSWRSRPQVWALQHFSRSMEGNSGHARHCTFGRHPDGHCSCEAFVMTEEASTRASISRIVMLAEALFEVLDEIHRQSVALSRSTSLSLVSLPAPGAVVDAFGTRIHTKADNLSNGHDKSSECYICLTEYEEGDCIRVLPCCHEFHMLCVDKWLKEVYRVCPLCRGNVCDETVGIPQGETA